MAYTDEDLQKITSAVKQSIINSGTNTSTASEIENISDVKDVLIHDKDGKIARITPTTLNADNVSRLQSVNDELVSRIQGRSVESDAVKDPFKFVGSFNTSTMSNFRSWLDNLHGTDYKLDNRGFYRAVLNDSVIEITSSPINYTTEEYLQVVRGRVSIESTTGLLTFSYEYNILERRFSAADGWTSWRIVASADNLEKLQGGIQAEKTRATGAEQALEQSINKIKGTVSATFDFTTGSTANWQNRKFAYKFTSGNNYHIKVVSDEVVATTYFSVRTADGTVVKNNILTGKGTREIVYKCEGDGDYLYMSIQSDGVAFAYNVEILNLSEISLGTIARETSELDARTTDIERMVLELPTFDDFVAGYKLTSNGMFVEGGEYSSTEKYFYIPSNTEVKVKGQSYGSTYFMIIYDTTYKVIERVQGQGAGVDVEHTIKYVYPVYIRVCAPTVLLSRFSTYYDGDSINAEIKELRNEVANNCIDLKYSLFNIGNIDVSGGYWNYGISEKRVSTSKGVAYHLFKDSKIIIPDGVSIYLGWRYVDADGNVVYKSGGWINNVYPVTEEADYVILLKRNGEEVVLNDKTELLKGLKITNGYAKQIFPTETYDANTIPALRVINHRGFNTEAPENTKAAFELSRLKGYRYVETDICFTSDNVPVCLHDSTIDRTSNGTGSIKNMTFADANQYIYSYKNGVLNKDYPNEKLLSFENFIKLCKFRGLRAYVEIKSMNEEQADIAVNIVKSMRMTEFVDWISFDKSTLAMIKARLPKARLGFLCNAISESAYAAIEELQSDENKVFLNIGTGGISDDTDWGNILEWCLEHDVEIEAWTVSSSGYKRMPYLSGVTTDSMRPWDFTSGIYNGLFRI